MGQFLQLTPDRWSHRGEAVGTAFHKETRVFGGIPGEPADARVLHEGQHTIQAAWKWSPDPHPRRVEPRCDRFHPCGGCPLMHLDEEGQGRAKRHIVREALGAVGLEDVVVGELVPCPDGSDDFRHVVKLGVGRSDIGRLRVGAWGRGDRGIVPIPKCPVAAPLVRRVMGNIAHHVLEMNIAPYDPISDQGVLRAFVVRASRSKQEVLVTMVAGRRPRMLDELSERIAMNSEVVGVALHLNQEEGNAIFHRDEEGKIGLRVMDGRAWLEEELNGIQYRIGPTDFFQTNPSTAELLYAQTLDRLDLSADVPFIDLYCGVGGMALPASKRANYVLGIEGLEGAVERAREAARLNGLGAQFQAGLVGDVLPDLARRLAGTRPVVAVNPARRGLEEGVVAQIMSLEPRKVAYVSCNPRALARDLVAFAEAGMQIGDVQLYDMFPNTAHVEAVVVLDAADGGFPERRAPRRRRMKG